MKSTPSMYPVKRTFNSEGPSHQLPNLNRSGRNTTHQKSFSNKSKNLTQKNMKTIDAPQNKSSYINSIKDLTGNIEYDEMSMQNIGDEQKRLKNILRKMNSDTIKLIEDISPKNLKKKKARPTDEVMELKNFESQNN